MGWWVGGLMWVGGWVGGTDLGDGVLAAGFHRSSEGEEAVTCFLLFLLLLLFLLIPLFFSFSVGWVVDGDFICNHCFPCGVDGYMNERWVGGWVGGLGTYL